VSDESYFDTDAAAAATSKMWRELGDLIAKGLSANVMDLSDPEMAIRWASCAEACFWQATGEGDPQGIKEILIRAQDVRDDKTGN
jgi:hypothetical protein